MDPDQELCLCFHVTVRKVWNFLRVEKPSRASRLSECFGAGTGCGWCRPFLERLFEEAQRDGVLPDDLPTPEAYSKARAAYLRLRKRPDAPGTDSPEEPTAS